MEIVRVLKSKYCWGVILISIFFGYYFVIRKLGSNSDLLTILLSVTFVELFALSNACMVRSIKQRIVTMQKIKGLTLINIFGSVLGIGAMQVCLTSGFCGVTATTTILYSILPTTFATFFAENSIWFLLISDLLLAFSFWKMKCFAKKSKPCTT